MNTYEVRSPYDGALVTSYDYASATDVSAVLATLQRGRAITAALTANERAIILGRLAELIERDAETLAKLVTQEVGKTIRDSRVEMTRAAGTARCAAHVARSIPGEVLDSDSYAPRRNRWGIVVRRPLGVVLAITPFNFPINLSAHKICPAFAAGCPVFFKPSPQNYLSGQHLVALCHEAGMPQEAIQFCMADVPELETAIAGDHIQIISFTGGVPASRAIGRIANGKRLLFELGGNDPLIVMPDGDVERAVDTAIDQRFGTAGQRCTAAKRVFVHTGVYDQFVANLLEKTRKLVVGDPMDESTFVGPVVSSTAADEVERRINAAIKDGARVLVGNRRDGCIIYPTILENVSPASTLVSDETFGPVIPLFRFDHVDDIVPVINGTKFGLQAGLFCNDIRVIRKLFESLHVGAMAVNDGPGFRAEHFPFGGIGNNSGSGREGLRYAVEEMSFLKTLIW